MSENQVDAEETVPVNVSDNEGCLDSSVNVVDGALEADIELENLPAAEEDQDVINNTGELLISDGLDKSSKYDEEQSGLLEKSSDSGEEGLDVAQLFAMSEGDRNEMENVDDSDDEDIEYADEDYVGKETNSSEESEKEKVHNDTETSTKQTVICFILPSKQVVTLILDVFHTVHHVKVLLSSQLKVSIEAINVKFQDASLPNSFVLKDLNIDENEVIQLIVVVGGYQQSADSLGDSIPFHITVAIKKETGERKLVIVEIIRPTRRKPYLGGYRHRITSVEYHHASAQTNRPSIPDVSETKESRDTQTVVERTRTTQTHNTTSTQMSFFGYYISNFSDKEKTPCNYVTADEYHEKRLKATITIQCFFRRVQAQKLLKQLKLDAKERIRWQRREELKLQKRKEARLQRLFHRILNPRTKQDFHQLYAMLEKWRKEEVRSITSEYHDDVPEQKAALYFQLIKEAQYIATIEQRKCTVSKQAKMHRRWQFLSEAALPKQWLAFDGKYTTVETPYTRHAARLKALYDTVVNSDYFQLDERIEVLDAIRKAVEKNDCSLVRELLVLVEREVELLLRGVSESHLQGLRTRINTLLFFYCKNPVFNPEAYYLHKVNKVGSNKLFYCQTSQHYLSSGDFYIKATSKSVRKCQKTKDLENIAYVRQDLVFYKQMLNDLRRKEEKYNDNSRVIYLIQDGDLQFLVQNIWLGKSILSGSDDLLDLEFVRWDKYEEWSPWNCILLNHNEALTHLNLDHLDEAYNRTFIDKVKRKHMESRMHFNKIPGMAEMSRMKASSRKLTGMSVVIGRSISCVRNE